MITHNVPIFSGMNSARVGTLGTELVVLIIVAVVYLPLTIASVAIAVCPRPSASPSRFQIAYYPMPQASIQKALDEKALWNAFPQINWNTKSSLAVAIRTAEKHASSYLQSPVLTPTSGSVILCSGGVFPSRSMSPSFCDRDSMSRSSCGRERPSFASRWPSRSPINC